MQEESVQTKPSTLAKEAAWQNGNGAKRGTQTAKRGFAAMDPEKQRAIARKGGKAAHESGNAHEFSSTEAAAAGRKGGASVSQNKEHMSAIGRKGGQAGGRARKSTQATQSQTTSDDAQS